MTENQRDFLFVPKNAKNSLKALFSLTNRSSMNLLVCHVLLFAWCRQAQAIGLYSLSLFVCQVSFMSTSSWQSYLSALAIQNTRINAFYQLPHLQKLQWMYYWPLVVVVCHITCANTQASLQFSTNNIAIHFPYIRSGHFVHLLFTQSKPHSQLRLRQQCYDDLVFAQLKCCSEVTLE